ncbi:MAG: ABC transporter substrate-binding protein [Lawsonibacter sp.]|nr:ABC transporter substrate-binding protein [Lawsonibacter sp.]
MKKKAIALLLVAAMGLACTACGQKNSSGGGSAASSSGSAASSSSSAAGEPIKIGFFAPITSAAASADGESTRNAVELAAKMLNDGGGINGRPVELVIYDDGLDTTQAVSIAEKLTTKDGIVAAVSGSYSGPTRVAAPIFQAAGIPLVSAYAVHPDVVNAGDFVFSQSFPGKVQGTAGAQFAVDTLGTKRIAIIAVDLDFGTELADTFSTYATAHGAEIISYDKVAISDNEFSSVVTKVKSLNPDLIYLANYYGHAAEVLKQCKLQGLNVPILGTEGADSWQFLQTAGEYAEGFYITTNLDRDAQDAAVQEFIKLYKETYKMEPDMVGASAYDAMQIVFEAIKQVGTDPVAMKECIAGMKDIDTVTGKLLYYTQTGEAVKAVQIQQVKDGAFHHYGSIDDLAIIDPDNYS